MAKAKAAREAAAENPPKPNWVQSQPSQAYPGWYADYFDRYYGRGQGS
jgi:hypothetical protein